MTAAVPVWQAQWLRLRGLRVERARSALRLAERAEAEARAAVDTRQARIAETRAGMATLAQGWAGPKGAGLPRWGEAVTAWRDALADRLERDEYALIDEERTLEEAMDATQRCRAQLVRAQARAEAVGEFVDQARRETLRVHEARAEREQEDRVRLATPQRPGTPAPRTNPRTTPLGGWS
jgi:hypothetical protein